MIFVVFSFMFRLGRKRTKKEPKTPYHSEFTKNGAFRWFLPFFHSCFAWVESVPQKSQKRLTTASLRNRLVLIDFVKLYFLLLWNWTYEVLLLTQKLWKSTYEVLWLTQKLWKSTYEVLLLTQKLWNCTYEVFLVTFTQTLRTTFAKKYSLLCMVRYLKEQKMAYHNEFTKSTIKGNVKESPTKTIKPSQLRKLIVIRLFLLFLAQWHNHLFFLFQSSNLSFLSKWNCKTFFFVWRMVNVSFRFQDNEGQVKIVFPKILFRRKESLLKHFWLYVCCYLQPLQQ